MTISAILEQNLSRVNERIAAACARAGRSADAVRLVAVTKSAGVEAIQALFELGVRDFGESRPQQIWDRRAALPEDVRWHLIGHLQTNKVRRTLPMISMVHSVDRASLAESLSAEMVRLDSSRKIPVTLETNVSGEESKQGYAPDQLRAEYSSVLTLPGIEIVGLMTMAPYEEEPENCRSTFRALRELRDELKREYSAGPSLDVLSMGMSNDFEVAIEEGATHVRVGTALFEGLPA